MFRIFSIAAFVAYLISTYQVHAQSWTDQELIEMKNKAAQLQSSPNPLETKGASWTAEDLTAIANQASTIQNNAPTMDEMLPWRTMTSELDKRIASDINRQAEEVISKLVNKDNIGPSSYASEAELVPFRHRLEVYVSWAMSNNELRSIFEQAAGNKPIRVLFRGVPEGMSIPQAMGKLKALISDLDKAPDVRIDPMAFRKRGVEFVPEMVLYLKEDGAGESVASHVRGISNISVAIDVMLEEGKKPQTVGPVIRIEEPDLIEQLANKMKTLDMADLKQKAIDRYWSKTKFYGLEVATTERVRELDPTVEVVRPIVDHSGRVLIRAKTKINPLKMRPFTHRMIIFNGTDPLQAAMAAKLADTTPKGLKPYLITTSLDRSKGWYALKSLEEQVNAPVYLLTKDIIARWRLEKVPVFIEAKKHKFIIHEVPVNGGQS